MDDDESVEERIALLERELGRALFPLSRKTSLERRLSDRKGTAQELEQIRSDATMAWLEFLEYVKREKDKNSVVWGKMLNWD